MFLGTIAHGNDHFSTQNEVKVPRFRARKSSRILLCVQPCWTEAIRRNPSGRNQRIWKNIRDVGQFSVEQKTKKNEKSIKASRSHPGPWRNVLKPALEIHRMISENDLRFWWGKLHDEICQYLTQRVYIFWGDTDRYVHKDLETET